jgi:hypothetical protein
MGLCGHTCAPQVWNDRGSCASNAALVTVERPDGRPLILQQPRSTSVGHMGAVQLRVLAAGDAPLRYQWFRHDAAVAGQTTAQLLMPAAHRPSHQGIYHVQVMALRFSLEDATFPESAKQIFFVFNNKF